MDWIALTQTIGGVLVGLGGWKVVETLLFRRSKAQVAEAEADTAEEKAKGVALENQERQFALFEKQLELAQQQNIMLQSQLLEKENRFQEQTKVVRELNNKLLVATEEIGKRDAKISALEAERKMKLCERKGCANREPQSGW